MTPRTIKQSKTAPTAEKMTSNGRLDEQAEVKKEGVEGKVTTRSSRKPPVSQVDATAKAPVNRKKVTKKTPLPIEVVSTEQSSQETDSENSAPLPTASDISSAEILSTEPAVLKPTPRKRATRKTSEQLPGFEETSETTPVVDSPAPKRGARKVTAKASTSSDNVSETIVNLPVEHSKQVIPTAKQTKSSNVEKILAPAPEYSIPVHPSEAQSPTPRYERIIANESLLSTLHAAGHTLPTEFLQKALPAVLRNSNLAALHTDTRQGEGILAFVAVASRILSGMAGEDTSKKEEKSSGPVALLLTPSEDRTQELGTICSPLFKAMGISCAIAETAAEIQQAITQRIEVIFSSLRNFFTVNPQTSADLPLPSWASRLSVCMVFDAQTPCGENPEGHFFKFFSMLTRYPHIQKAFISRENTPGLREAIFQYLEDPEYVNLLPSAIKERVPRQFAHALTATAKFQVLLGHLKTHKPACAVVFANTKAVAEWIAYKLHGNDIKVELMIVPREAQQRQELVKSVRSGATNIIVTTTRFAQVLGFFRLNAIYLFDIPETPAAYFSCLGVLERSRNPIAISFICEDYGYNMSAIEKALGFSIPVVSPDPSYFEIKDTSDYPLEADGRVKRIGAGAAAAAAAVITTTSSTATPPLPPQKPVAESTSSSTLLASARDKQPQQQVAQPLRQSPSPSSVPTRSESPSVPRQQGGSSPSLPPLQAASENRHQQAATGSRPTHTSSTQQGWTPPQPRQPYSSTTGSASPTRPSGNEQRFSSRRDERAREVLESARSSAKEARQRQQTATASAQQKSMGTDKNSMPTQITRRGIVGGSVVRIAFSLIKDAAKSAVVAAGESLATNIEQQLPTLSSFLNKLKPNRKHSDQDNEEK